MNILNNEHIEVTPVGEPTIAYSITAKDGWYLCLTDEEETIYSKAMSLLVDRNWSQLQVVAEADVPPMEESEG